MMMMITIFNQDRPIQPLAGLNGVLTVKIIVGGQEYKNKNKTVKMIVGGQE
jgi:hypothetical protein